MTSPRYRLYTVVTIVVIASAVLFFFLLKPAKAPVDEGGEGVLSESPPAGVLVETLENGERLVKNVEEGYELKVSKDKYLYENSIQQDLVVQNFLEPDVAYGGNPGCKVSVSVTDGELKNVDSFASNSCKEDSDCENFTVEERMVNNQSWYELRYVGSFVGSNNPQFVTAHNQKTYTLYFQCTNDDFVNDILSNFSM